MLNVKNISCLQILFLVFMHTIYTSAFGISYLTSVKQNACKLVRAPRIDEHIYANYGHDLVLC